MGLIAMKILQGLGVSQEKIRGKVKIIEKMKTIRPDDYDFLWKVGNFSYFPLSYWLHGIYKEIDCIATYKEPVWKFYISKNDRKRLSGIGLRMLETGMPDFRKRTLLLTNRAKALFPEIEKKNLSKLDNKALAEEFEAVILFAQKLWELFFYTEYFMHDRVQEKAKELGINTNEYLTSSPKEMLISGEFYDRCRLAMNPSEKAISEHANKYSYINYNKGGITLTPELLKEAIKKIRNPDQKAEEMDKKHKEIISNRKQHKLADAIREMAELKFIIRSFINKTLFGEYNLINKHLDETSRRTGIKDFSDYHYKEIIDMLNNKKADNKNRKIFVVGKFSNWDNILGKDALPLIELLDNKHDRNTDVLQGNTGNGGYHIGKVKIIPFDTKADLIKEISKMNVGDVLVSGSTGPEMIEACHKAGAIVTDEGGICSHAAIISRELGIPSVIATKIATEILKDGDLVEVDADRGIVRKIKS